VVLNLLKGGGTTELREGGTTELKGGGATTALLTFNSLMLVVLD